MLVQIHDHDPHSRGEIGHVAKDLDAVNVLAPYNLCNPKVRDVQGAKVAFQIDAPIAIPYDPLIAVCIVGDRGWVALVQGGPFHLPSDFIRRSVHREEGIFGAGHDFILGHHQPHGLSVREVVSPAGHLVLGPGIGCPNVGQQAHDQGQGLAGMSQKG